MYRDMLDGVSKPCHFVWKYAAAFGVRVVPLWTVAAGLVAGLILGSRFL
jgi:hypothetical protein